LDLGLDQMTTGQRMGVHGGTVWNWESGQRKPETKNLPAIIAFLGYDPRPDPGSLTERLVWYREGKGWSQERMAEFLRVDEATISGWERGEHAPTRKSVEKIEMALRQSRYPTVGAQVLDLKQAARGMPHGQNLNHVALGAVLISYPKGRKDEFAQRRTLLLGQYPPHLGKLGQRFGAGYDLQTKAFRGYRAGSPDVAGDVTQVGERSR